jgi:hypothetical protein
VGREDDLLVKRLYGSSPIHLLAHVASLALALWAIGQILDARSPLTIVVWLVGAVLLHDAILWPLYSLLDQLAWTAALAIDGGRRVPALNYLRVPFGLSVLMFMAAFPAITEHREQNYTRVSGIGFDGYLGRWLLACGLLFAGSAVIYAVRVRRAAGASGSPAR